MSSRRSASRSPKRSPSSPKSPKRSPSSSRGKSLKQLIERKYDDEELIKYGYDIPLDAANRTNETLEETLRRLRDVDSSEIVSGKFSWIDEVVLVALGKKPIALTHFDSVEEWDYSAELWALNNGVNQYITFEAPYNVNIEPAILKYKSAISGKNVGRRISINNQVSSIIWYREDTKNQALLLKKLLTNQLYKNIILNSPYFDIIQGLLYGYNEQAIEDYLSDVDFSKKSFNQYLKESKEYIRNEIEENKSDSWSIVPRNYRDSRDWSS